MTVAYINSYRNSLFAMGNMGNKFGMKVSRNINKAKFVLTYLQVKLQVYQNQHHFHNRLHNLHGDHNLH